MLSPNSSFENAGWWSVTFSFLFRRFHFCNGATNCQAGSRRYSKPTVSIMEQFWDSSRLLSSFKGMFGIAHCDRIFTPSWSIVCTTGGKLCYKLNKYNYFCIISFVRTKGPILLYISSTIESILDQFPRGTLEDFPRCFVFIVKRYFGYKFV